MLGRLSELVREALAKIADDLAMRAGTATNIDERNSLLEAVALVRANRGDIETKFKRAFKDIFERRMFNQGAKQAAAVGELSLVSDEEVNDQMIVDRLARKARGKLNSDEVLGIRARLGALLEREWFDESAHPAAPDAVFEALRSSLADISPKSVTKTALLEAFEPHLTPQLNTIYVNVNERLRAHQILPVIKAEVQPVGSAGKRTSAKATPGTPAPGVKPQLVGSNPAALSANAFAAGASQATPPRADSSAAETINQAPVYAAVHPSAQPSEPRLPFGGQPPLVEFNAVLSQLAAGQGSARARAARLLTEPEAFAADLPWPEVNPPLVDSLSHLQATSLPSAEASGKLWQALSEEIAGRGSPLDQVTVEIVSIVFDYINTDRRVPEHLKLQLMRLQVVAVKAALIDRSFFARRTHPMRRLVDRVIELAVDPESDVSPNSLLVSAMKESIDFVIESFERDLSVFEEALQRLDQAAEADSQARAERISAEAAQAELREKQVLAEDEARPLIDLRLDESTPAFAREFLYNRWISVMGKAKLAPPDTAAISWDDCLRLVDQLVWSVGPKNSEEVPHLAQLLPKMIQGLVAGLRLIDIGSQEREAFFNALLLSHKKSIEAARKVSKDGASRLRTGALRMNKEGTIRLIVSAAAKPAAPADPTPVERGETKLEMLKKGDRIELDNAGVRASYKLAWISPARSLFILSRHPHEPRSIKGTELADWLKSGRAVIAVGEDSMLDRAIGVAAGMRPSTSVPVAA